MYLYTKYLNEIALAWALQSSICDISATHNLRPNIDNSPNITDSSHTKIFSQLVYCAHSSSDRGRRPK